jgi:manganese/zinc/iron transport system permease protein
MTLLLASAFDDFLDAILFRAGHNTAVVMRGTVVLGIACGVIGSFLVLRKRALLADAISHAALPGVCIGFMLAVAAGRPGKSPLYLLSGAAIFAMLGVAAVQLLTTLKRIREDAAIGVVLSVFFALGVVLLRVIQDSAAAGQAGLNMFIFGQAATLSSSDASLILIASAVLIAIALLFYKELRLLCFDAGFARSIGHSTLLLDALLLALVTAVTVVGLGAVGAILMVALLIIPAAAARFWTNRLPVMLGLAAGFGGGGCAAGTAASASAPGVPTGPAIVVACGLLFAVSMLLAPRRGLLAASARRAGLARRIARDHLLRAMFEAEELHARQHAEQPSTSMNDLLALRHWRGRQLRAGLKRSMGRGEVQKIGDGFRLTDAGRAEARRIVRAHRLWELYLVHAADIDPSHVDRDADELEHFLTPALRQAIERQLEQESALSDARDVPDSPHRLRGAAGSAPT